MKALAKEQHKGWRGGKSAEAQGGGCHTDWDGSSVSEYERGEGVLRGLCHKLLLV